MRLRSVFLSALLLAGLPLAAADVPIHGIQGAGASSPLVGQSVTTTGVVTALRTNGFYLQALDGEADADPATSEGVLVFTSSAPPAAAAVGNRVRVSGSVLEYRPSADPASPPLTEIGGGVSVALLSSGNPLPAPVLLTSADLSPAGPADRLERYEGMRVHVPALLVVAPTGGSVDEANATGRSNGVLVGVLPGTPRPFREAGADPLTPLPAGSPCCVPRFDGNPERLRVDTDGLAGRAPLDVASGTTLQDVVGPLDYGFRTYTLLPESRPVATGSPAARAVPVPSSGELTVGSLNLQRFFDAEDDGEGTTLTPTAFSARLAKAALAIRTFLRTPDVLAVVEVEDLPTLRALAARLSADALAAGAPDPAYQAFLEGGNDPGGIDVGFLVASRVAVLSVVQEGKGATYTDPTTGSPATLNDRPPLVLTARWAAPGGTDLVFTVVANHLRSLNDSELDSTTGRRVRAKRQAQAEYLATLLARLQAEGGGAPLLAVGDFNAFELSDGLVDVIGTVCGAPAPASEVVVNRSVDLVEPDLVDLCAVDALVAPSERYSYVYDGNAQLLDHALASAATLPLVRGVAFARLGADFPESMRGDAARPERLADHDGLVVRLGLSPEEGRSPVVPVPDGEPASPFRSRAPETIP
jgi:predicted extracellular nuclease